MLFWTGKESKRCQPKHHFSRQHDIMEETYAEDRISNVIISKVIRGGEGGTRALNTLTITKARIMEIITIKVKANWALFLFRHLKEMIRKFNTQSSEFQMKPTFGIQLSHILALKGLELKYKKIL